MANSNRAQFKNNFLYWSLFIYVICLLTISPGPRDPDQIRIPGFALLLLILVQVIFPNFRFQRLSNLIAIIIILATAIIISNFPLR